jgi:hypothetical protein
MRRTKRQPPQHSTLFFISLAISKKTETRKTEEKGGAL